MKQDRSFGWAGHALALFTVGVWGTTFISTKVLLRAFTPVEILLIRFVLGFLALTLVRPRRLRLQKRSHALYFAAAGLTGCMLYYLLENIALSYSTASNIGVIVSCAPLFAALFSALFLHERLRPSFFVGFCAAIAGIVLISFGGGDAVQIKPVGDVLALCAAAAWGLYSILCRKLGEFQYPTLEMTRHIFFYGIVFMLPPALLMGFSPDPAALMQPVNLCNLAFLSLCASALCFVTWNMAVKRLGAVRACVYIYLSPVITVLCAALVLSERMTRRAMLGMGLVILGLVLSEGHIPQWKGRNVWRKAREKN